MKHTERNHTYSLQNRVESKETSLALSALPRYRTLTLKATQPQPALPINPPQIHIKTPQTRQNKSNPEFNIERKSTIVIIIVLTFIGGPENSSSVIFNKPLSATKNQIFQQSKAKYSIPRKLNFKFMNFRCIKQLYMYV